MRERSSSARTSGLSGKKLLIVVNDAPFFLSHRLNIARAAAAQGMRVSVATPPDLQSEMIKKHGFDFLPFNLARWGANPIQELRSIWELAALYRRQRPDVVHHVTIKPIIYGSLAARCCKNLAVVNAVSGRGQVFTAQGAAARLRRGAVGFLYHLALRHPATRVIFQNSDDRDYFVNSGLVPRSQTALIHGSGVDIGYFQPAEEPGGESIVLFASRLMREKGILEFAEAAQLLRDRKVRARCIVAGLPDIGNPGSISEAEFAHLKDSGTLECIGQQDDMRSLLQRSHIVCLPSYYGEGIPRILIEAAACGRPIVTTDWPGCRDIVAHGVNGLLVKPRDSAALAAAIEKLAGNPALRAEYGNRGREKVLREGFSEEVVVGQTMQLYQELLSAGEPPAAV